MVSSSFSQAQSPPGSNNNKNVRVLCELSKKDVCLARGASEAEVQGVLLEDTGAVSHEVVMQACV